MLETGDGYAVTASFGGGFCLLSLSLRLAKTFTRPDSRPSRASFGGDLAQNQDILANDVLCLPRRVRLRTNTSNMQRHLQRYTQIQTISIALGRGCRKAYDNTLGTYWPTILLGKYNTAPLADYIASSNCKKKRMQCGLVLERWLHLRNPTNPRTRWKTQMQEAAPKGAVVARMS